MYWNFENIFHKSIVFPRANNILETNFWTQTVQIPHSKEFWAKGILLFLSTNSGSVLENPIQTG